MTFDRDAVIEQAPPTTEFVKRCASDEGYNGEILSPSEFEWWLSAHDAEVRNAALAPIEALHSKPHQDNGVWYTTDPNYHGHVAKKGPCPTAQAIAEIKKAVQG